MLFFVILKTWNVFPSVSIAEDSYSSERSTASGALLLVLGTSGKIRTESGKRLEKNKKRRLRESDIGGKC